MLELKLQNLEISKLEIEIFLVDKYNIKFKWEAIWKMFDFTGDEKVEGTGCYESKHCLK